MKVEDPHDLGRGAVAEAVPTLGGTSTNVPGRR